MAVPTESVTLEPAQIAALLKELATTRHDINNALSLISAAAELIRMNPDMVPRMVTTLNDQPGKIGSSLQRFSSVLEQNLGTRQA
jgi:hypothetical protein